MKTKESKISRKEEGAGRVDEIKVSKSWKF